MSLNPNLLELRSTQNSRTPVGKETQNILTNWTFKYIPPCPLRASVRQERNWRKKKVLSLRTDTFTSRRLLRVVNRLSVGAAVNRRGEELLQHNTPCEHDLYQLPHFCCFCLYFKCFCVRLQSGLLLPASSALLSLHLSD